MKMRQVYCDICITHGYEISEEKFMSTHDLCNSISYHYLVEKCSDHRQDLRRLKRVFFLALVFVKR